MPDLFPVTLAEMTADARREVAMRKRVYPRQVASGRLKPEQAERQIAIMEKIVTVLEILEEPLIDEALRTHQSDTPTNRQEQDRINDAIARFADTIGRGIR